MLWKTWKNVIFAEITINSLIAQEKCFFSPKVENNGPDCWTFFVLLKQSMTARLLQVRCVIFGGFDEETATWSQPNSSSSELASELRWPASCGLDQKNTFLVLWTYSLIYVFNKSLWSFNVTLTQWTNTISHQKSQISIILSPLERPIRDLGRERGGI